jgi:hypothetical protein
MCEGGVMEERGEGARREEQKAGGGSTCKGEFALWKLKLLSKLFILFFLLVISGCKKKLKLKN